MNELLVIEGTEVERIEYQGQPVLSLPMIDKVHQRPDGTAGRNFRENRERFIMGVDAFDLPYDIWSVLTRRNSSGQGGVSSDESETMVRRISSNQGGLSSDQNGHRGSMTFLTLRGYLKVVKSFRDDLSWAVQGVLIDSYFRLQEMIKSAESSLEITRLQSELLSSKEELITAQRKLIEVLEYKKPTTRPITAEEREQILTWYKEGLSQGEIRRRTGRSKGTISNLVRYGTASGRVVSQDPVDLHT